MIEKRVHLCLGAKKKSARKIRIHTQKQCLYVYIYFLGNFMLKLFFSMQHCAEAFRNVFEAKRGDEVSKRYSSLREDCSDAYPRKKTQAGPSLVAVDSCFIL